MVLKNTTFEARQTMTKDLFKINKLTFIKSTDF